MGRAGGGDSLVIGGAEAAVVGISDDTDGGPERESHLDGPVCRAVVHEDYLERNAVLDGERFEAGFQERAAVPVHDNDGYLRCCRGARVVGGQLVYYTFRDQTRLDLLCPPPVSFFVQSE